ncbi:class I poly(R)-hydroxyalkanoic acid synthase [Halomonas sp. GDM18]|nr:class I poly(R)-hydroxyalkanoic acid synthase [Halomonas sp. GDM18]
MDSAQQQAFSQTFSQAFTSLFPDGAEGTEWASVMQQASAQYQALMSDMLERLWPSAAASTIYDEMGRCFQAGAEALARDPQLLMSTQTRLFQDQMALLQGTLRELNGESVEPVITPARSDRRFRDEAWQSEPYYHFLVQQYLLFSRAVDDMLAGIQGLPESQKRNLEFYARQYVSAFSPSNFASTNPEVQRVTRETGGQNLLDGLKRLRDDLANSAEGINVAMTDTEAFRLGDNIAVTPGDVVFENELIQLIQYRPATEKAFSTPLLVVPPWINKYYILDLRQDNSMMRWLVEQGHTVFLISWRNPGPEQSDLTWADYMQMGPLAAMDAIEQATGEKQVNILSYCIGGTLTASTMAYLAAEKQSDRVRSVSYMATLQDFSDPGEIGVFLNEPVLQGLEKQMAQDGYLDGRVMAFSFNLLRENDLFWSFYVSNYLKGEAPTAFDLLYWNTDGTNLPAGTHAWYLRHMYLENRLVQPGGIELDGVPIDLSQIETPSYWVSAREDHIAKWQTTYNGTQLPKASIKRFVLGGSGHIAGIVNPPHKNKYGYATNDSLPATPDEWLEGTEQHEGSWWNDWQAWMTGNGFVEPEPEVSARTPGEGKLDVIEAAPGRYARQTIPEVLGQSVPEEITSVADAQLKAVRDVQQTVEKSVNEALKQVTLPLEEAMTAMTEAVTGKAANDAGDTAGNSSSSASKAQGASTRPAASKAASAAESATPASKPAARKRAAPKSTASRSTAAKSATTTSSTASDSTAKQSTASTAASSTGSSATKTTTARKTSTPRKTAASKTTTANKSTAAKTTASKTTASTSASDSKPSASGTSSSSTSSTASGSSAAGSSATKPATTRKSTASKSTASKSTASKTTASKSTASSTGSASTAKTASSTGASSQGATRSNTSSSGASTTTAKSDTGSDAPKPRRGRPSNASKAAAAKAAEEAKKDDAKPAASKTDGSAGNAKDSDKS